MNNKFAEARKRRNKLFAYSIMGVIGLGLLFPVYYVNSKQDKPQLEKYPKGTGVRGSFLNSGSTDIGKDTQKYKNNYEEHKRKMNERNYENQVNNNNNNNDNNNKNN